MQFHSISDFLAMGGYAFYVWLAYGVTLVVLVWLALSGHIRRRQLIAEEGRRQRRELAQGTAASRTEPVDGLAAAVDSRMANGSQAGSP